MSLREKINSRLDEIERGLRSGRHLSGEEGRLEMTESLAGVTKFYSVLDDGELDFISSARMAIEQQLPWM